MSQSSKRRVANGTESSELNRIFADKENSLTIFEAGTSVLSQVVLVSSIKSILNSISE